MYASREIISDSTDLQAFELDITENVMINGMEPRNQTNQAMNRMISSPTRSLAIPQLLMEHSQILKSSLVKKPYNLNLSDHQIPQICPLSPRLCNEMGGPNETPW